MIGASISSVPEPGNSVFGRDSFECVGYGKVEGVLSSRFGGSDKLFELEPGFLDGVQVG
jgi:hypothetical protein